MDTHLIFLSVMDVGTRWGLRGHVPSRILHIFMYSAPEDVCPLLNCLLYPYCQSYKNLCDLACYFSCVYHWDFYYMYSVLSKHTYIHPRVAQVIADWGIMGANIELVMIPTQLSIFYCFVLLYLVTWPPRASLVFHKSRF